MLTPLAIPARPAAHPRDFSDGIVVAVQGVHLLGEWHGCDFTPLALNDAQGLRSICLSVVEDAGLHSVGDAFHKFEPQGITGTVLLAESHMAIHTWPESGFVSVDVYVCNYREDNTHKALKLYAVLKTLFQPHRESFSRVLRGHHPA